MRGLERCSPMMFWANSAASSAAVAAPSDCRMGMMSLSIVFGSPTTVRW